MEKPVKLYIDSPAWSAPVSVDDFIITIGKTKSNSVYHVAEVTENKRENRTTRYYVKAFRSDLITALNRSGSQKVLPIVWYNRNKKNSL